MHRSYLQAGERPARGASLLKGMAHITGGGLLENIPRILPEGAAVVIEKTWPVPPLFSFLVQAGNVSEQRALPGLQHGHRHGAGHRTQEPFPGRGRPGAEWARSFT